MNSAVKHIIIEVVALLSMSVLFSCIREDRDECPGTLVVDIGYSVSGMESEFHGEGQIQVRLFRNGSPEIFRLFDTAVCPDTCMIQTGRGYHIVNVILIPVSAEVVCSMDRVLLEGGMQADSLYACSISAEVGEDETLVRPVLHKEFATVYIKIEHSEKYTDMSMEVTGDGCGLYLPELAPVSGNFRYVSGIVSGDGMFCFRMYRQNAGSLLLNLVSSSEGLDMHDIPLGKMISETGYDFFAEDLRDVYVKIDIAEGRIITVIEGWEDEYVTEIY